MEKEFFFTLKDVKRLFIRRKKLYQRLFFIGFLSLFILNLCFPPIYKANAVFKYASQEGGESDLLRSFLQKSSFSFKESGVQSVLQSRTLLKKVLGELALNVEVQDPIFVRWFQRAKDRIWAEIDSVLPDRDVLAFSHVFFEGVSPLKGFIRFLDDASFEVLNDKKEMVWSGSVGSTVILKNARFFVAPVASIKLDHLYSFRIIPWIDALRKVQANFQVKSSKKDKNVLNLFFSHEKKAVPASFLNAIMVCYQEYLKKENEEIATLQMEYLEKRQKELLQKYEKSLEEHVAFLSSSLRTSGFLSFKQEIDLLEKPNEECLSRLYDVDLALGRFPNKKQFEEEQQWKVCSRQAIKESSVEGLENLLLKKEHKRRDVELAATKISEVSLEEDFLSQEAEGLSLEIAQRLLEDYNKEQDALRLKIQQLKAVEKQIVEKDFQIASLSAVLEDPISQEMIQKASKSLFDIQDRINYSDKDIERFEKGMVTQKLFISKHVSQLLESYILKSSLVEKKIASLGNTTVHLLSLEKELIQKQLGSLQEKMESLPEKWKRENQLLMQRDLSLGVVEGLTQLTESKNIHHQLFQVESKPIDWAFISPKASKRLLFAQSLLAGVLLVFFFFGAHFLRWLFKGTAITADTAKALGVTFCGFLEKGFSSKIEDVLGDARETLRKVASFINLHRNQSKSICVSFLGKPVDSLVVNVGALLHLQGLKVLIVDCTPPKRYTQQGIGLYEYLLGEGSVTVTSKDEIDRIAPGAYHTCFVELLCRESFHELLAEKRKIYDVILLSMEANPLDMAASCLKSASDISIVYGEDVFYEESFVTSPLAVVLS